MLTRRGISKVVHCVHLNAVKTWVRPALQRRVLRHCSLPEWRPLQPARSFATQRSVDEVMEDIQELYATARDELEMAAEETEKMTIYAEDDRAAAREELKKLQNAYRIVVEGPDKALGVEVQRRVGQRIRELENAVTAMEEMAQNQD